uniref:Transcription activation suppressor b n=1 Tax=Pundamilia nyererei TaxID=303518 RepID=A0A3B4F3W8_9CICH
MALNPSAVGKRDSDYTETTDLHPKGGEPQKNSAATSATANQNGDQPGCGDSVMPEQEAPERRRSMQADARSFSSSPLPAQRSTDELPRRNFQIPRKIRERKGLYQFLPPESREFEDLVKIISSFYLDASSRGTFTYCKARLIHNELLEKEFIEKRREMKQEGRTEQELAESYCFLFPDKSKVGLLAKPHSYMQKDIDKLGRRRGVYLSKYSDLLQINPFEVGAFGDMIIFKVMRGRIKHIHENTPKNAIESSPKFDCHLSKSANRVTSLLSYRAFELTQQYFFEFAFDEIKARPRHVCPYAVVSFQYKGKEAAATPMAAHRYCHVCVNVIIYEVGLCNKRKIYDVLLHDLVMKCGMSCSLFEVVDGKGKPTSGSLAALVNKLERDRMVSHIPAVYPGSLSKINTTFSGLPASPLFEPEPLTVEPHPAFLSSMESFIPAVHYGLFKLRPNPGKDLSSGVERQATDYLTRMDSGTVRPFILPDYKYNVNERTNPVTAPRPKCNMDAVLRSYVHNPANYILPLNKAKDIIERIRNPAPVPAPAPAPVEYSPVSDWGGSDRGSDRAERPSESSRRRPNEYDKDKMKQLLKLIQLHKKALVKDPGKDRGEDGAWDANSLKRKFEGDERGGANKHQRTDQLSNGEPSRAVMESMGIYDTDLRARGNTNTSAVSETQRLLKILLATLNKAVAQGSVSADSNHGEPSTGSGRVEPVYHDPDHRKQNEPPSQTNYAEEDMDCSPGSPFSPGSPPEQKLAAPAADVDPEPKTPAVVEVKKMPKPTLPAVEEVPFRPSISLDTILNQEIHSLSSDIKNIMHTQHINYTSQLPPRLPPRHCWVSSSCFSHFVVPYVSPVPIQGHVKALCEKMDKLIPAPPAPSKVTSPPPPLTPSNLTTPPPAPIPTTKTKAEPSLSKSTVSSQSSKTSAIKEMTSTKIKSEAPSAETGGEVYSPSQVTAESPEQNSQNPGAASGSGPGLLAGSLIGQLKPEVFSSLVEIFKDVTKNTVKFYIYSGDEGEESAVCKEIKEYLKSLGNSECSPQTFLENSSSLDKLLIIIRNEDIAAHVHKIPALVSLKKLPSVSFAGVDSLDDVKNHTYNELFVSGGFMVSDEFVLNPDLITQDRLQGLLKFLEEQSTPEHPWQWKVHCKSQKKLKELGRLNTNAMGLLNLLTAYQKKHLVEFLPYHECDTQSRQAPDLDCLIKLQAQHTQQRHLIFLTERPFEMFLQYSRNGIVIASIDDVMSGFHSLIGSINQNELPTPPSTVVNDECVEEEDMSLDSDDGEPPTILDPPEQKQQVAKKPPQPPPPENEFRPPLPDQQTTPETTPTLSNYSAFKTAISQFKATNQIGMGSSDIGSLSPGGFPVNPHQSFLCPSASWSSYTGSSSYTASPAYPASPCSGTQEPPTAVSSGAPTPPVMPPAGPLANLASLPLEVKPPPPPHLMMLGHGYSSDVGGAGAAGTSPLTTTPGFIAGTPKNASGTPNQPDRTLSGPGDGVWGTAGTTACDNASNPAVVPPAPVDPSGLAKTGEALIGSTPCSQGVRTQVNCADGLGASVGIPTVPTRGGSVLRPKLPPHPMSGVGYGSIGCMPPHMDHRPMMGAMGPGSLGSYRGRGVPPVGLWPRPGRGHERGGGTGGGPCSWGYPAGRGGPPNYYTDYSYSHNYAPE